MTYFSRVTLDASNYLANRLLQQALQNNYREHQLLWQLFPNDGNATRDFIYRSERRNNDRLYYVVSQKKPEPAVGWKIETKTYSPNITEGTQLSFSLRVNPIVTRKNSSGKRHRHDVVMDEKNRLGFKKMDSTKRQSMGKLIEMAGNRWLMSRGEQYGFNLNENSMIIESYDQHRSYKKGNKDLIRYSTMDVIGTLQVSNKGKFIDSLVQGIGPAKAFGCGLMLVRRV